MRIGQLIFGRGESQPDYVIESAERVNALEAENAALRDFWEKASDEAKTTYEANFLADLQSATQRRVDALKAGRDEAKACLEFLLREQINGVICPEDHACERCARNWARVRKVLDG